MKTYLPYCCKRVGVIIVFVAISVSFAAGINSFEKGYVKGYNFSQSIDNTNVGPIGSLIYKEIISPELSNTLNWISITLSFGGFLLYIFSKEKIEDEFLQKLRYMSLEKSLILTWLFALIFLIVNRSADFKVFYILQLQLIAYVLIYHHYKMKFQIK